MSTPRVLVSWIGHRDLGGMRSHLPKELQERIDAVISPEARNQSSPGPIETLLANTPFDVLHLLSNYPAQVTQGITRYLVEKYAKIRLVSHVVPIANPTDYRAIFEGVDRVLAPLHQGQEPDLHILLSPGTPAMAAVWVLLGKSRYPATFWQTHQGKAWETEIPFDLTMDYLPHALQAADRSFQGAAFASPQEIRGFEAILGQSPPLLQAVKRAHKAAIREVSVLILGESGTGKELFARAIHEASPRRGKPFVAVNCAAIPKDLLESELFGHVKGAFTGAVHEHAGVFEQADGGTLFLDEIGECPLELQAKMLRALQPPSVAEPCLRLIRRIGARGDQKVDVRIIAATNRDPLANIQAGRFREDLYYRLAAVTLPLPALRERRGDAVRIAQALLAQANRQFKGREPGYKDKKFSSKTIKFISEAAWPGNVRQLHNAVIQAAVLSEKEEIQPQDMEAATGFSASDSQGFPPMDDRFNLLDFLEKAERHYLAEAWRESGGKKTAAAARLGLASYQALDAKFKRLNLDPRKIP